MNQVETALRRQLLDARNDDGGWGYEASRTSRLEPTCWALLALGGAQAGWIEFWPRGQPRTALFSSNEQGFRTGRFMLLHLRRGWRLRTAPAAELQRLADALVEARGLAIKPSPIQRQDNSLQGWSWIDGTFSWAEPTAWALLG